MEITEKLARYIISLQSIADMECGTDEEDIAIRDELEKAFPILKKEREDEEFKKWLWEKKVEEDERVKAAREESRVHTRVRIIDNKKHPTEEDHQKSAELCRKLFATKELVKTELLKDEATLRTEWLSTLAKVKP